MFDLFCVAGSGTMSSIIPRSKAKGTDICAFNKYYYIIRSDLGCYMQTSNLNKGADISIFSLHPACQNGDHYIGGDSYFHIINGNSCRRVTNLTTDSDAVVLQPSSQLPGWRPLLCSPWLFLHHLPRRGHLPKNNKHD